MPVGKIIPNVHIRDYGAYNSNTPLSAEVYENPDALLFKGTHEGALKAWICGECGHAELFVKDPQEFYAAYLNGKS